MRNLLVMVGSPASGKSTWIKENQLEPYTVSPDTLRLLVSAPEYRLDGNIAISQDHDSKAWKLLDELIEGRMEQGNFTVIDATHTREKYLRRYKKLADKYRYRMYVKRFDVDVEELLHRNGMRETYKQVPEDIIRLHAERMKTLKIPNSIQTIENIEEVNEFIRYNKVEGPLYFIGDIHGTIEPLNKFLDEHYTTENGTFVFLGDYIDRGQHNAETLQRLMDLSKANNVIMLEGNHERWLWYWANDELDKIRSREFLLGTMPQLDGVIDKKEARLFYRRLRTFVSFKLGEYEIFASHGGVTCPYPHFITTEQLIKGVGKYEQLPEVYESWNENGEQKNILIHGHRNIQKYDTLAKQDKNTIFNLDGSVEMGGELRVVKINAGGTATKYTYQNENQVLPPNVDENPEQQVSDLLFVDALRQSKFVKEVTLEPSHIHSFNFTHRAFKDRKWNKLTTRARGLFVNVEDNSVAARSYEKFFNLNEMEETSEVGLASRVEFPVAVYQKYNGYLGIIGYDKKEDKLMVCSKSTNAGPFAERFQRLIDELGIDQWKLFDVVKENNVSLIFEVVDPDFDPHIIKYDTAFVRLLDVVHNDYKFSKWDDEQTQALAHILGVMPKEKIATLHNLVEMSEYMREFTAATYTEGAVCEDMNGYMWKLKGEYYKKWKSLRNLKMHVHKPDFRVSDKAFDADTMAFLNWLKTLEPEFVQQTDIISLRDEFYAHHPRWSTWNK